MLTNQIYAGVRRELTMPIYKLNSQLAVGIAIAQSARKKDRHHDGHHHTFWELPESDRYGQGDEWTEDADKQNVEFLRRVSYSLLLMDLSSFHT